MTTQAGGRLRQATAVRGITEIGSQPIHEELCPALGTVSFVSLPGEDVTLLPISVLRRPLEAGRHPCGQSYEPVRCEKNDPGLAAGCTRRWRNSPMRYAVPTE